MTPRFNPVRDQIAFMSYANNRPRVYTFDLGSGSQRMLGEFNGISFAPRFSPNGGQVVLSATRGGGSDIFVIDLGSGAKRQITSSGAIDTSPCFSPDGSQIVFNSDRGGSPQLYMMSASGGGARRISFGNGSYGSPVWSPRGDLIAFTRLAGGRFSLGVMGPDGTGERILTEGFTVESPTFCPMAASSRSAVNRPLERVEPDSRAESGPSILRASTSARSALKQGPQTPPGPPCKGNYVSLAPHFVAPETLNSDFHMNFARLLV